MVRQPFSRPPQPAEGTPQAPHEEIDCSSRDGRLRNESQLCLMHDMCSPLATILGTLQLLSARGVEDPGTASLVESSIHAARRELRLVQCLVDAFLEDEGVPLGTGASVTSLASCAMVVVAEFQGVFSLQGRMLALDLPAGDDPLHVWADRLRIERVIGNLLDNALRHVPTHGSVIIQCGRDDGLVCCVVEDDGPGIPASVRERLFMPRVQGASSGLAGLGLYSCKRTLERYGGTILCEERAGGGARFCFRLPGSPTPA